MKILYTAAIVVTHVMSIFAADDWVTTGRDPAYPPDLYFVSVGTSDRSVDEAKGSAMVGIRRQISTKISATVIDEQQSVISGNIEKTYNKVESRAQLSTSGEIAGVQIVKTVQKGKLFYAFAILEKDNFITNTKSLINDLDGQLKTFMEGAKADIGASKISPALQKLSEAKKLIVKIASERSLLSAVAPLQSPASYSATDITMLYEKCIGSLKMSKVSGDNQAGEVGSVPGEPFVVKLTADNAPVSMIPVKLTFMGKKITERYSDAEGKISFMAGEEAETGAGTHIYTTEISLPVSSTMKSLLAAQKQTFTHTITANPCSSRVEVIVAPTLSENEAEIEKKVKSRLEKFNIKENPSSGALVKVTVSAADAGGVSGLSESNSFIKTNVTALFSVLDDDGKQLASFTGTAKGVGGSLAKSAVAGIDAMRLDNEFKDALGKLCGFVSTPKQRIAVFNFTERSDSWWWNEYAPGLADMIITDLINSQKYDVVERLQLNKIMEEKALGQSGAVEENEAIQIAQVLHADVILIGSVHATDGNVEADARVIDMKTGIAKCAMSSSSYYRDNLLSLANDIVAQVRQRCTK